MGELSVLDSAVERPGLENGPPAIRIADLSKTYSGRKRSFSLSPNGFVRSTLRGDPWETVALNRVTFSVDHGEVFGLLGPNGSGKTTLIKILSNLVIPESGLVQVEGINVLRNPYAASARLQTVLADSIGLEKRLAARDNLRLFASLYSVPKAEAERKIDKLMSFFGLEAYAFRSSQSYSTGMSRKLAVCRVLLSYASVIVFDEPTSGMDPASAYDFRRLILKDLVEGEGKTILMATHNLEEATSMCTRIALLDHGSLLAVGTPDEIRKRVEDRIDLEIKLRATAGGLEDLREELAKVHGVHSAEFADSLGGKVVRLSGTKDLDYLEVFSLLASRGLKVTSLETSSPSLEEAFLKLTREERK